MILGFLMLLFIGFARIEQFWLIREDPMVCGILGMQILPAISTFWRYPATMGLNQSNALLNMGAELRRRVWKLYSINYDSVCISVDTTVSTVLETLKEAEKGTIQNIVVKKDCVRYFCLSKKPGNTCVVHNVVEKQ